jgi:hypothetical protein
LDVAPGGHRNASRGTGGTSRLGTGWARIAGQLGEVLDG